MYFKSIYEELAALYLRLNCFLVNPCYVVEKRHGHSLEIDLIAFRRRGAQEVIDEERELKLDDKLFEAIASRIGLKAKEVEKSYDIVVVGDVKSERRDLWSGTGIDEKIGYALRILGIPGISPNALRNIRDNGYYSLNSEGKLIVVLAGFAFQKRGESPKPSWDTSQSNTSYLFVPIEHVIDFAIERVKQYKDPKSRARIMYYYPSLGLLTILTDLSKLNSGTSKDSRN